MNERAKAILYFWFKQSSHKEKFKKNSTFDQKIRDKFFNDYQKAINNEYNNWQDNADECLALIILLDPFSRNLFRNNKKAFAMDNKVLQIAAKAITLDYHEKLAQDHTPSLPVIQHAVYTLKEIDNYVPDIIILLQPTSPLRTTKHINEALELFINSNVDTLVSVTEVPHNMNPYSIMELKDNGYLVPFMEFDENKNLRQLKPKYYARNGAAIYICTYECLMEKNTLYGERIIPYIMKKEESFDLDDQVDWEIMQYLIKNSNDFEINK